MSQLVQNGAIRLGVMIRDRLRYSWIAQAAVGMLSLTKVLILRDRPQGLAALAAAHRTFLPLGWDGLTRKRMARLAPSSANRPNRWKTERIGWNDYLVRTVDGKPALSHGLIVKPPVSENEKGVLVVWVEYNLATLLTSPSLPDILRHYRIVFSTSWSPPDFSLIWAVSGEAGAEICIIPSNPRDEEWINAIPQPVRILPFFASHWIADDPKAPSIPSAERKFDLCVVANWAPFKRHWILFRALRSLPADLRIALIGQHEGSYKVEHVQRLAVAFGVRQQIAWFNRLAADEVRKIQADSRVGLMLSKREGSCLAIAESLLADAPCGVLSDAHLGSRAFINEATGMLLREETLAGDIARLLAAASAGSFSPREWALKQIEAGVSSARLNVILAEKAKEKGEEWTLDIKGFCLVSAVPAFLEKEDADGAENWHREFETEFGVSFIGNSQNSGV